MSVARPIFPTPPGWLNAGVATLKRLGASTLDLIYPPGCPACQRATARPDALCAACWSAMRWIEQPICDRLGAPLGEDHLIEPDGRKISFAARQRPPVFSRARAAAVFAEGPARRLAHRLKYGDREELAAPMGRWMARAGAELLDDVDVLVPIPLHWTRLAKRRFNQAAALAEAISAQSGAPVGHDLLKRARATPTQTELAPRLRAQNVHKAFVAPKARRADIEGRKILLVDDVMTTGATLNAAAASLLRAGAARVDALVFALALAEK